MNSYDLSRAFFDFSFENPEKVKPNHVAIYFFAIEHCNRLGWKEKFGFPTTMVMEGIGVKSYNTYINTLNDLVEWGFIKMIEKSKNQHSSNIVALSKFDKAQYKALDKALVKHRRKQRESTGESNSSIIKQVTSNKEQVTSNNSLIENKIIDFLKFRKELKKPMLEASKAAFLKKLEKLSNGNEEIAIEILEQSMANGWQGIFELKTKKNERTKQSKYAN